ncbi:MAG: FkbM family methyltransferase [Methanoregula sp.]|nr:FkbM family methyltransferase [Methanoregula sp.]
MNFPASFTTPDKVTFNRISTPYRQIFDVRDYSFDDIRAEDRVIDIGANVGAFCIRAARLSRHVTAIEPVTTDILEENIRANKVPVRVIRAGLGNGKPGICSWDDCSVTVPTCTLGEIIDLAGGCDFLKCDCEGAEWLIRPEDLEPVRRIEMELHIPPICGRPAPALLDYIGCHYDFSIVRTPCHDVLGSMGILHGARRE